MLQNISISVSTSRILKEIEHIL